MLNRREFLTSLLPALAFKSEAKEKKQDQVWSEGVERMSILSKTGEVEMSNVFLHKPGEKSSWNLETIGGERVVSANKAEWEFIREKIQNGYLVITGHTHTSQSVESDVLKLTKQNKKPDMVKLISPPSVQGLLDMEASGDFIYAFDQAMNIKSYGLPSEYVLNAVYDPAGVWVFKVDADTNFVQDLHSILKREQELKVNNKLTGESVSALALEKKQLRKKYSLNLERVASAYREILEENVLSVRHAHSNMFEVSQKANQVCGVLGNLGISMKYYQYPDAVKIAPLEIAKEFRIKF